MPGGVCEGKYVYSQQCHMWALVKQKTYNKNLVNQKIYKIT